MSVELAIFYLILLDSIFANILIWFNKDWYMRVGFLRKYFPASKGWALLYLLLVLWIGFFAKRV